MREVVITGTGAVCRLGDDEEELADVLREGRSPPFDVWPAAVEAGCACTVIGRYAGDLSDERLGVDRGASRFMGRAARLALLASRRALAQAGVGSDGLAIVFGSGAGDVETHREIGRALAAGGARRVKPTVVPRIMASTVSANLSNVLRNTGPSLSVSAACAGGAWNLVVAAQLVASGLADAALAGGAECEDLDFHAGFDTMRAYHRTGDPRRPSRPYAADRAGFVFGEGAGAVVLETREGAERRGADILAVLRGYGASSDGDGDMVAPSTDGAARAMRQALDRAGVRPFEVDYVNTHATSTVAGDLSEVDALRDVFGDHRVRYSSTKGHTGHTITAAGTLEAVFTTWMLRGGWIAPSAHAEPLDPALSDFPPVLAPRRFALRTAVSNSFGFGGTNVSLVLGLP